MAFNDSYDRTKFVVPIKGRTSVSINGIDLRSYGFELTSLPDLVMPPVRQRNMVLDGKSGSIPFGDLYDNWSFSLSGQMVGLSLEDAIKKKDAFLRQIDIEQTNLSQFVIGDKEFYGLNFQLNGAPLFYGDGSITATASDPTVTGSGTKFLSYVKPGATFEIAGDTNIYTVSTVTSDTSLELTSDVASTYISGMAYRVERKRYLIVNYDGSSSITPVSDRGYLSQAAIGAERHVAFELSIGFYTVYPYWVGDIFDQVETSVSSATGAFISLEGLGNAPVSPKYVFEGAAADPEITVGDISFYADFETNQLARTINNNVDVSPSSAHAGSPIFKPSKFGGYSISPTDNIVYGNKGAHGRGTEGAFLVRCNPDAFLSAGSSSEDYPVFLWYDDNVSDYVWLKIERNTDKIVMSKVTPAAGEEVMAQGNISEIVGEIEISGWWSNSGILDTKDDTTYYAKLFLNGELLGSQTTLWSGVIDEVFVDCQINNESESGIDISEVVLFNKALSDEELRGFYYSGQKIVNTNTMLKYTGSVDANDILIYDSMTGDTEFYDNNVGTKVNKLSSISGKPPMLTGDDISESDSIFLKTSSGTINKLHVIYRPHFR